MTSKMTSVLSKTRYLKTMEGKHIGFMEVISLTKCNMSQNQMQITPSLGRGYAKQNGVYRQSVNCSKTTMDCDLPKRERGGHQFI